MRDDPGYALEAADGGGIRPLTEQEFALFQALIHREAGIYLSEMKKSLLVGRLSRHLRELGLGSFGAYYRRVIEDADELVRMLDSISTNETHFFREPRQFDFLEQSVYPEWTAAAAAGRRPRRIRVWSAACSTGEEPYSLAMSLLSHFPPASGWNVEILATDISTRVLERARAATWPMTKASEIPSAYLKDYMLKGTRTQEGKMKAGPQICEAVRFERLNLNDAAYALTGFFDLIFCRNCLIYFNAESKAHVIRQLLRYLAPTGHLFMGHAEMLNNVTDRARSVGPNAYVHAGTANPEALKLLAAHPAPRRAVPPAPYRLKSRVGPGLRPCLVG